MQHRIGLYLRVSTDEQAQVLEGSLDSQRHRLNSFLELKNVQDPSWGKVVEAYVDDGYSAKDTNRPAYQRMMKDVHKGKINLILITDLSRLSRNILDFCLLLNDLKKHNAKFLSVKEQFDTSTPVGEMMVMNMINLAQFERKQTSERVSLNFHARAQRGLLNGGKLILGYDKDPTNTGIYLVNDREAEDVRRIFEIFLEKGSCPKTIRELDSLGIRPKVKADRKYKGALFGRWHRQTLLYLLTNPAYIGIREVNKGNRDKRQEDLKSYQRYQKVPASWPAILDVKTFEDAQKVVEKVQLAQTERLSKKETRVFLVTSILRCSECGESYFGAASHGEYQVHRYYQHRKVPGRELACKVKRIRADELEADVVRYLEKYLRDEGHFDEFEKKVESLSGHKVRVYEKRRDSLRKDLETLEAEISSTFRFLRDVGETAGRDLVQAELAKLSTRKNALVNDLAEAENFIATHPTPQERRKEFEAGIQEFRAIWGKSTGAQKKRLITTLFGGLVLYPDRIGVVPPGGMTGGAEGISGYKKRELALIASSLDDRPLFPGAGGPISSGTSPRNTSVKSASTDMIGGPKRSRTADLLIANETLYQLSYRPKNECRGKGGAFLSSRKGKGAQGARLHGEI
jgi:site-specific DNA recombinase